MWSKILIYIWIGLTVALIVVPTGVLLYRIGKKLFWFLNKKADLIKENVELKHIKSELKQQKDELIASNEYGPFHAQEQEIEDKKLDNENLVAPLEWEENHSSPVGNQEGELKGQTSEKKAWYASPRGRTLKKRVKSRTIWKKTYWSYSNWWFDA